MKHCVSCGAQLDDSATYCSLCETKQDSAPATPPPVYQTAPQPNYVPTPTAFASDTATSQPAQQINSSDACSVLNKHGGSGKFLAAAIMYTIMTSVIAIGAVLIAILCILFFPVMFETYYNYFPKEQVMLFQAASSVIIGILCIFAAIFITPIVLNCIGIWMFRHNCKNKGKSTKGLSIIKGSSVANIVIWSFSAVILFLSLLFKAAQTVMPNKPEDITVLITSIATCAGIILFYAFIIKCTTKLRDTVRMGTSSSVPTAVPVLLIILCVFIGIGGIASLNIYTILISIFDIALYVLFTVCIFKYNSEIKALSNTDNSISASVANNGL